MLTNTEVRNFQPRDRQYKIADGGGMYLDVRPNGAKYWRLKYRFGGKEKLLALGVYPDIGLKDARNRRDEARRLINEGIDPGQQRKLEKLTAVISAANTFEAVAREYVGIKAASWANSYGERMLRRFERDLFPLLGARSIAELKAPELLAVLRKIETRGAIETAHRARGDCGQVFRFAIATGRAEHDIAADLVGALKPKQTKHFPSVTEPEKVAGLLRALDGYQGSFVVMSAIRLAPLLFVRPGELRHAEWGKY